MLKCADANCIEGIEKPAGVEIHLSPDATGNHLLMRLQRTHRRAAGLLTKLIEATRQTEPDLDRTRELAMGIRFELDLAQALTQPLADGEANLRSNG